MTNISSRILVLIPSVRGVSDGTWKSINSQSIGVSRIVVSDKIFPSYLSVGERASKSINESIKYVDLKCYDYILRTDDDAYLPSNFLEENLKLNADVVGSSGYGQLIKMEPFMFYFNGRFPEVTAEDSYIFYYFQYLGLKAYKYKVRPEKLKRKKHNLKYWLNVGEERYRIGYLPHMVILSFRDSISGFKVGFNVGYIFLGYLLAFIKGLQKYPFSGMVTKLQLLRLVKH